MRKRRETMSDDECILTEEEKKNIDAEVLHILNTFSPDNYIEGLKSNPHVLQVYKSVKKKLEIESHQEFLGVAKGMSEATGVMMASMGSKEKLKRAIPMIAAISGLMATKSIELKMKEDEAPAQKAEGLRQSIQMDIERLVKQEGAKALSELLTYERNLIEAEVKKKDGKQTMLKDIKMIDGGLAILLNHEGSLSKKDMEKLEKDVRVLLEKIIDEKISEDVKKGKFDNLGDEKDDHIEL